MPIKRRTPLITVDLGENGGTRLFYRLDEVDEFLDSESEATPGRLVRSTLGGSAWQRIAEARSMVGNARSSPDYLEQLNQMLVPAFGDATPFSFPTSVGPRGKLVTEIAQARGDGVAAGAVSYFTNQRLAHQRANRIANRIAQFFTTLRVVLTLQLLQLLDATEQFSLSHQQALSIRGPQAS